MKILVHTDLRFIASPTPTGVGKHLTQMISGLHGSAGYQLERLATADQHAVVRNLPPLPTRKLPLTWKTADALWTLAGRPWADSWCGGADWVYCPKNDFIPLRRTRTAFTIHGAAELDPLLPRPSGARQSLNRWRRRTAYQRMVRQADALLVVSEFLKDRVIQWFQADPDRIHVVGNGVQQEYFTQAPTGNSSEQQPYFLCVGGLNFLDGGDRILRVAAVLRSHAPEVRFLVAGWQHEPPWFQELPAAPNVQLLGYVPSGRLAALMRDAAGLFFPTRYETFGIAAAEAMAAGCCVITCRSSAVPEIAAEAAIYVDPDDPASTADTLLQILRNPKWTAPYITRGRARAAHYTWAACVERLRTVLES